MVTTISSPATLQNVYIPTRLRDKLERLLKDLPLPTPENLPMLRARLLRVIARLDIDTLDAILKLNQTPTSESGLLIRNAPLGLPLPKTPLDGAIASKPKNVTENFLVAVGLLLGQPTAFRREKNGELVPNIVPVPGHGDYISNEGYQVPLDFHNDLSHLGQHAPGYVLLLCLRGDPRHEAITYHVDVRDVLPLLDARDVEILRTPSFRIELPASFITDEGSERFSPPMPVISGPDFAPQISGEFNSTVPLDERAARALRALEDACRRPGVAHAIDLREGDCLVLRNRAALHARSVYNPQFERDDRRWLQRLYVMADLWQSRHAMRETTCLLDGTFL